MKLFQSNIEDLERSSPAKMGKRFVCCVIDMIIVIFITALVFSGVFSITENTSAYQNNKKIVNTEIEYYQELTKETHLIEYMDGERLSGDIIAYNNINKAIYLSYLVYGNNQQQDFVIDSKHEAAINGAASLENDNIAYFYTQYIPTNDKEGKIINMYGQDPIDYLFDVYKKAFGSEATFMFIFDKNERDIPILKSNVAYSIFHYLYINESDKVGSDGSTYYQTFANAYINMIEDAEQSLIKSEPYYSDHYLVYREAYCNQARYTNIGLLISLFIAYLIGVLLPKYLLKNEKTIGYKLFGLGVIRLDGEENKWYVTLIKSLLGSIGFIVTTIILYLFPPFSGIFDAMFLPFTINSKISLIIIILIVFVLGAIINLIGLFTHYRQNAINLLFNDKVVDIHYLDEGDNDDKYEGRSY